MLSQEVLLLHEVGALVKFVGPEVCESVLKVVMPKVGEELYQRSKVFVCQELEIRSISKEMHHSIYFRDCDRFYKKNVISDKRNMFRRYLLNRLILKIILKISMCY